MERIAILVSAATDSQTALDYGYSLALAAQLPVVLIYEYDVPLFFSPDPLSAALLPLAESQKIAGERMEALVQECQRRYPQVATTARLALVDPETPLEADDRFTAPVLVTTLNREKLHDWWEESPALDMLQDSHHSVLAVPEGFTFEPVSHITLALRPNQSPDDLPMAALQSVLALTGALLRVVTVNATEATPPVLLQALHSLRPEYYNLSDTTDVDAALADFVQQYPTGWIAVIPGTYGFWEGLFHKSHTKALAAASPIPLLALRPPGSGKQP